VALVVAREVPTSSTMAVPHGPAGVGQARFRMREDLRASGAPDSVVDDAILILSELLSNSCRHARPLPPDDSIRADWRRDARGELTISVTDGGGPTRPLTATPSVTAHGGRGLSIITALARDWGVHSNSTAHRVTVWAVVAPVNGQSTQADFEAVGPVGAIDSINSAVSSPAGSVTLDGPDSVEEFDGIDELT
jgi:anti-sigma regulatory factor (Ser/Thr protein kinase)